MTTKNPIDKPIKRRPGNPTLIPGNPGNSGGKKGRSGRKRLPFVEECSELTDSSVLEKVRTYLAKKESDPTDSAWRWCAEYVSGYSKAKPAQAVRQTDKHDNDVPLMEVHVYLPDNRRNLAALAPAVNGNGKHGHRGA